MDFFATEHVLSTQNLKKGRIRNLLNSWYRCQGNYRIAKSRESSNINNAVIEREGERFQTLLDDCLEGLNYPGILEQLKYNPYNDSPVLLIAGYFGSVLLLGVTENYGSDIHIYISDPDKKNQEQLKYPDECVNTIPQRVLEFLQEEDHKRFLFVYFNEQMTAFEKSQELAPLLDIKKEFTGCTLVSFLEDGEKAQKLKDSYRVELLRYRIHPKWIVSPLWLVWEGLPAYETLGKSIVYARCGKEIVLEYDNYGNSAEGLQFLLMGANLSEALLGNRTDNVSVSPLTVTYFDVQGVKKTEVIPFEKQGTGVGLGYVADLKDSTYPAVFIKEKLACEKKHFDDIQEVKGKNRVVCKFTLYFPPNFADKAVFLMRGSNNPLFGQAGRRLLLK